MGKKITRPWTSSSWGWPSCHQPRTLSFRANTTTASDIFKTINSAYFDLDLDTLQLQLHPQDSTTEGDPIESVIQGLRSDRRRLFFEPGETSSILEAKAAGGSTLPFKDSVVLSMESRDPFLDFRSSMEEMVHAHSLNLHPQALEDLLCWYLRVNGNTNHAYILAAFVDLLLALSSPSASASASSSSSSSSSHDSHSHSPSSSSPLSFSTSCSLSSSFSTPCAHPCLEADHHHDHPDAPTTSSFTVLERVKEDISHDVHHHQPSSSNA